MSKFIAFMCAVLPVLTLVGGALRRRPTQKNGSDAVPQSKMKFSELLRKENKRIFYDTAGRTPDDPVVVESNDAAEEPWVSSRSGRPGRARAVGRRHSARDVQPGPAAGPPRA